MQLAVSQSEITVFIMLMKTENIEASQTQPTCVNCTNEEEVQGDPRNKYSPERLMSASTSEHVKHLRGIDFNRYTWNEVNFKKQRDIYLKTSMNNKQTGNLKSAVSIVTASEKKSIQKSNNFKTEKPRNNN